MKDLGMALSFGMDGQKRKCSAVNIIAGVKDEPLRQRIYMGPNVDKLKIVRSELQDKAGVVAAATWAMLNLSKK